MLKFMRFQVIANQTRLRQASARAVSCSLVQSQRLGVFQLRNAFTQARTAPNAHNAPRTPKQMIQGARALIALGPAMAAVRTASQPPKKKMKRMHTKRTPSRNFRSSGLRSGGRP